MILAEILNKAKTINGIKVESREQQGGPGEGRDTVLLLAPLWWVLRSALSKLPDLGDLDDLRRAPLGRSGRELRAQTSC